MTVKLKIYATGGKHLFKGPIKPGAFPTVDLDRAIFESLGNSYSEGRLERLSEQLDNQAHAIARVMAVLVDMGAPGAREIVENTLSYAFALGEAEEGQS